MKRVELIAQLSPAVAALGPWCAEPLAGGELWRVVASEAEAAALSHLAWDLLEVLEAAHGPRDALEAALVAWREAHGPLELVAASRGLGPVVERLARRLGAPPPPAAAPPCAVLGEAPPTPEGASPLCAVLGRGRAWLTQPRLPWLRDRFNRDTARALAAAPVSRAALKWRQTRPLLTWLGLAPHAVTHWLELGAAPGGITAELARGGDHTRVTALDRALLATTVSNLKNVTALQADVMEWHADTTQYSGLVCDLNGPPRVALAAVARHAPALAAGAPLALTLKLDRLDALHPALERTRDALAGANVAVLRHQHLSSHRAAELVVVGRAS